MSARLIGRTGATAGQDFVLMDVATIGAAPDSEIRIVAPGVSRRHARIVADKNQYFLEDAGATNGTFLNGGRVQREELRHLDVITLGRAVDLIFIKRENEAPVVVADQISAARVEIADGPEAGTVVDVPKGELTFGRAPSCNVVLASGLISKVHARLQRTANQLVLQDLQSINGTFVNGARVDSVVILRNGDVINFAGVRSLSVAIEGAAAAAAGKAVVPAAIAEAPAFNQEWKTRFVWAPDELALIEAARAEAMQLAAVRAPGAGPAADKKPAAAAAKPAAPAPASPKGDIAAPPVVPKPAPPVAPKAEGAPPAKPPVAVPPAPVAAAPPAKAEVAPKVEPPPPAKVDEVKPQAPVKPAGPAQAAVQAAEAPIKPGTPVPITADPAAASPVAPKPPAAKADAPPKPPAPPAPPVAGPVPPKPVAPPAAAAAPKPPMSEEPAPTMAIMPGGDVTLASDNTLPGAARAPRIRGIRLVGPGIPIALGLGTFVVGRAVGSDVRLDDRQVSRSHARITIDEVSAMIEDLQTVNGTLVNGKEVKARQALRPGDTVQFGAAEFKVELTTT